MTQFIVRFADKAKYPGHLFRVEKTHPAEPTMQSVWLFCLTDPSIKFDKYVRMVELERVAK
jgi:hypothetical protein